MLNLANVLENSATYYPTKTAIIFGEQKFSYAQLNGAVNMIANGLVDKGIKKGDKVALSMLNLPYFPMIYYGILKTGAVVVPLNVLLKRKEIAYHLKDSDAKAYFCFIGTPELKMGEEAFAGFSEVDECEHFILVTPPGVESPIPNVTTLDMLMKDQSPAFTMVATSPRDSAVILYTSGTTGQAKGAELSHNNLYSNAHATTTLLSSNPNDIHCIALPLFHSFGQTVQMNAGLMMSNTLVLIAKFLPDVVLSAFEKENITVFAGVPTMWWALLNYPKASDYDLEKISNMLRIGVSGGSALPVEVMKQVGEKYKINILEGYGLSETSPVASFSREDLPSVAGSIGVPIRGVEMQVVNENNEPVPIGEVGEICIRGPNLMKGYYKRPEATAETFKNGWFHSGDLGKMDEKGYYYIVDRKKDMVLRGGFNVYPREVEEILMTNPKVSLVAVVGEPNDQYGEEVVAYVVLKDGETSTEDELRDWAKENMAAYKYPRKIYFKDALPMNATGKILKRVLRE
ncbi:MAG: long-chain fatty acid--CoA ligase [Candidatus Heimdallarchaeota archaeon]|nr:long-chain fatty acid--CoA ligase [Candidatus Heimdallarchaeota archaeon]